MKLEKKIEPAEEDVESLISVVEVDGHRVLRVNSSDQEPQNRNEKLGRIIKQALLEVFDHSD